MDVLAETAELVGPGSRQQALIAQMVKLADASDEALGAYEGGREVRTRYEEAVEKFDKIA